MTIAIYIAIGLVYLLLVIILTTLAKNKRIGPTRTFFISFFLTPVLGYLAYRSSDPRHVIYSKRYVCQRCGFEYTEDKDMCPNCKKEGYEVDLKQVVRKSI
ncbi:MAG: hypothetical protein K9I94_11935 [Bacteroidales bacterium]|nr:hypothetical protein [Bacteroidales bacterium]